MGCRFVKQNQQVITQYPTTRQIQNGPSCFCQPPCTNVSVQEIIVLYVNQYAIIQNTNQPKRKIIQGPINYRFESPYQRLIKRQKCLILDQDDYIIVQDREGKKNLIKGPCSYKPKIGQKRTQKKTSMVVPDSIDKSMPFKHLRGPCKFYPQPYQQIVKISQKQVQDCIQINLQYGAYISKQDGNIILLDEPQFYMPKVGQRLIKKVKKITLIQTDFCVLKQIDGNIVLKMGIQKQNRTFFPPAYSEMLSFNFGKELKKILSTLPQFVQKSFPIRTLDNVLLQIEISVNYKIIKPEILVLYPIDFYLHISYWCQYELLDSYCHINLLQFIKGYSQLAHKTIQRSAEYFHQYGIDIIDIQVTNFKCIDNDTQKLLDRDIQTYVNKQNQLKEKQVDIQINERENQITRRQKDLDVILAEKDNQVDLQKKQMQIKIQLKSLEMEIDQQKKKKELLEIKKENLVLQKEFQGKATAGEIVKFFQAMSNKLSKDQILYMWRTMKQQQRASLIYSKVGNINMYPNNSDLKFFNNQVQNHGQLQNQIKDGMKMKYHLK